MEILKVSNLSKKIGKKQILTNINFEINSKEIVGLVGENGSGKSSLFRTILGLYKIDSGEVIICNTSIKENLQLALSYTGSIIENPSFYDSLSGKENLDIISTLTNVKDKKYEEKLIQKLKLENRINDKVKKYSLGMKMRLGIISSLINKPCLLVLDEPLNGLDALGIYEVREILKDLIKENDMAILISSHNLSDLERLCDKILIIKDGKITRKINISESTNLEQEFLKEVKKEGQLR